MSEPIELKSEGVYLVDGKVCQTNPMPKDEARENTMAYQIHLANDSSKDRSRMNVTFDALASHDITYVGIIQTARASGLEKFPLRYAMTNCHNSLCAVGGTINEDDHVFGLSAAKKYGGEFVPANLAVIHQYVREELTTCGGMVLGSDSHTRYGALGTMGVGEGGPELVKQLLKNTYDIPSPEVVLVYLTGAPKKGVGPHDAAIALVKAVFASGFVKNKVLEFVGPGVANLSVDFRNGIDVMTTETTCLSSIWTTDEKVKAYYANHGRAGYYKELKPGKVAYYDSMISFDLSKLESMIALPFHPSNAFTVKELCENPYDILKKVEDDGRKLFPNVDFRLTDKIIDGKVYVNQGVIAGCAGGLYENLMLAASILRSASIGDSYFGLNVYAASQPVNLALTKAGAIETFMKAGAIIKPCFCGPCFGAGDVPSNNGLSIRHTTRNFPNREGSKPGQGQIASVALMDARSIAATAANKGFLKAATDVDFDDSVPEYEFDPSIYERRIYHGFGKADPKAELKLGPNITDWPKMYPLEENLLLELTAVIKDAVTTTDELIPSGETSSYRSNPLKLAEFTLSRRVPEYVGLAKAVQKDEAARREGKQPEKILKALGEVGDASALIKNTAFGSCVYANKPGDGSAREQAASCQKVLGGYANIAVEYATKRYRSNCINWGIVPFTIDPSEKFEYAQGDFVFVPGVRSAIETGKEDIPAKIVTKSGVKDILLHVKGLTADEKEIILRGCLMNYYAAKNNK